MGFDYRDRNRAHRHLKIFTNLLFAYLIFQLGMLAFVLTRISLPPEIFIGPLLILLLTAYTRAKQSRVTASLLFLLSLSDLILWALKHMGYYDDLVANIGTTIILLVTSLQLVAITTELNRPEKTESPPEDDFIAKNAHKKRTRL